MIRLDIDTMKEILKTEVYNIKVLKAMINNGEDCGFSISSKSTESAYLSFSNEDSKEFLSLAISLKEKLLLKIRKSLREAKKVLKDIPTDQVDDFKAFCTEINSYLIK